MMFKETPTVSLKLCDFNSKNRVLTLGSNVIGLPKTFKVVSHKTGRAIRFAPVNPGDPLFDQDQWDGEQQIYRPVESNSGVDHMIIYREC